MNNAIVKIVFGSNWVAKILALYYRWMWVYGVVFVYHWHLWVLEAMFTAMAMHAIYTRTVSVIPQKIIRELTQQNKPQVSISIDDFWYKFESVSIMLSYYAIDSLVDPSIDFSFCDKIYIFILLLTTIHMAFATMTRIILMTYSSFYPVYLQSELALAMRDYPNLSLDLVITQTSELLVVTKVPLKRL